MKNVKMEHFMSYTLGEITKQVNDFLYDRI